MGKMILEPAFYLRAQAMNASWEGPILFTKSLEQLSFELAWTDAASPVGTVALWVTNDPRAREDHLRGLTMATGQAQWKLVKLPAGSVDVDGASATWAADDTSIAITGVGAGRATINVTDLYGFAKLAYTSGSGGVGDTMNATREGN